MDGAAAAPRGTLGPTLPSAIATPQPKRTRVKGAPAPAPPRARARAARRAPRARDAQPAEALPHVGLHPRQRAHRGAAARRAPPPGGKAKAGGLGRARREPALWHAAPRTLIHSPLPPRELATKKTKKKQKILAQRLQRNDTYLAHFSFSFFFFFSFAKITFFCESSKTSASAAWVWRRPPAHIRDLTRSFRGDTV